MAFGLGFAGGFADAQAETPPSTGSGTALGGRRRRLLHRAPPAWPTPPTPVRARARLTVTYRWEARVVRVEPQVRTRAPALRFRPRVVGIKVYITGPGPASRMEAKNVTLSMTTKTANRMAQELELNDLLVALVALKQEN